MSVSGNDLRNILGDEGNQSVGDAKYSGWLRYSDHLVVLISISDNYAMEENFDAWFKSLGPLYRNAYAYMDNKERAESKKKYDLLLIAYADYQKELFGRGRIDQAQLMTSNLPNVLHDFDMFIKMILKSHDLLIPTVSRKGADDAIMG